MSEKLGSESSEDRARQWEADRETEERPSPGAHFSNYGGNEAIRQMDLASAEGGNVARAARELGLTSTEWHALRQELGRSPQRGDVGK